MRLALLLVLLVPVALAQSRPSASRDGAVERYHAGAQAYIDGELAAARAEVEAGLATAPDDARLQALRDLLDQEENEDQQQGNEGEPESQPDEPDGEGEPPPEESGAPPETPGDDSEADADATGTDTPDSPPQQSQAGEPSEAAMSRAQAERILDAVGGDERLLLRELRRAPTRGRRTDKDW